MRVLIIKLTSMGDLMHALPALTDAAKQFPDIQFDWVADRAFAAVPKWHPNVDKVIISDHRRWRQRWWTTFKQGELRRFYQEINEQDYDVVIDMQGNMKSALVSLLRKGPIAGLDKYSCREKPAHWFYRRKINVSPKKHAVERLRQIMATALGYGLPDSEPDYGIKEQTLNALPSLDFTLPDKYFMLVHNASWLTKLWPLEHWQAFALKAAENGYGLLIPSGNDEEYQRARQIALVSDQAHALPRLGLDEVFALMQHAEAAICSDTGLAHMAAMIGKPAITIYGSTDTHLIGTLGKQQQHLISDMECAPCYKRQCPLPDAERGQPVCMKRIGADQVWRRLQTLLQAQ